MSEGTHHVHVGTCHHFLLERATVLQRWNRDNCVVTPIHSFNIHPCVSTTKLEWRK